MTLAFLTLTGGCYDTASRLRRDRIRRIHAGIRECKSAGPVPNDKLDFGIAILRTLPSLDFEAQAAEGMEWPLGGLMHWAAANDPSQRDFDTVWQDIRTLYPRAPGSWRHAISSFEEKFPDLWVVRPLFGYLLYPHPSIEEVRVAGTIYVAKQRRVGPLPRHLFELCI